MARTVVHALVAIAGCSGTSHAPPGQHTVAIHRACRHDPPKAGFTTLYGTVTDRSGHPLSNATIALERWHDTSGAGAGGVWVRDADAANVTTDADGNYEVTTPFGSYRIEAHGGAGTAIGMGYRADRATRRLDIVIGATASIFDAAVPSPLECEPSCPRAHAPREEWWREPTPCPEGSTLATELDANRGSASISCVANGVGHGPFTSWRQTHDGWVRTSGWMSHGNECGAWVDPEPIAVPQNATRDDGTH